MECGVERVALFTAASDAFTKKNINMTVEESLEAFEIVLGDFEPTSSMAGCGPM